MKVYRKALVMLVFLITTPQVGRGYFFERVIDLYTYDDGPLHPRVHSYAKAVLFTDGGARVYNAQVIFAVP